MVKPVAAVDDDVSYKPLCNEEGAALIIVLAMLLLLMILGATLLSSSTTELRIAGNYRNTQEAFYSADAVLETLYSGLLPKGSKPVSGGAALASDTPISDLVRPGTPFEASYTMDDKTVSYTVHYSRQGTTRTLAGKGFDDTFTDVTSIYFMDVSGTDANDHASVDLEAAFALVEP